MHESSLRHRILKAAFACGGKRNGTHGVTPGLASFVFGRSTSSPGKQRIRGSPEEPSSFC
jgi:hypothetical protein